MNKKIVSVIINLCLGYKKDERFLIVCDDVLRALAQDFYRTAKKLNVKAEMLEMRHCRMHGEEPPKAIAHALKQADAAILLTSMSLSHTKARKNASSRYGTRIASLPGVNLGILNRSILIDYKILKKQTHHLSGFLTRGKKLEIRTKTGSCISMSIEGRKCYADNGLYKDRGAFGNLPAGEICIAPIEGTTNGYVIIDGSAPFSGKLKRPVKIAIRNGYAEKLPFRKVRHLAKSMGRCVLNVAEIGIGLNPKAIVSGNTLEDEKAKKTAHIAFGNNKSFGGNVDCRCHLDFVFYSPRIFVDGKRLLI